MTSDRPQRLALRPAEAAAALGVNQRTLRRWQRDEGFPSARVGNVVLCPVAAVEAWLAARVEGARRTDAVVDEILAEL